LEADSCRQGRCPMVLWQPRTIPSRRRHTAGGSDWAAETMGNRPPEIPGCRITTGYPYARRCPRISRSLAGWVLAVEIFAYCDTHYREYVPLTDRLSKHAGAPLLVTVQFGNPNDNLYLLRRAAIEFVGIDDIAATHYALYTGGTYREYLDRRSKTNPRLIRTDGYDDGELHLCHRVRDTHFPGGQPQVRFEVEFSSAATAYLRTRSF